MNLKKSIIPNAAQLNYLRFFSTLLMALLISVFSFPELDFEYSTGIDPPLTWLYNHLFSTGLSPGEKIIFPHGPLAFLMYPLADNFFTSLLVIAALQIVFTYSMARLIGKTQGFYWLITATICWFIFSISNFNQLILSNILISYLIYLKKDIYRYKYLGFALLALATFVKAYVAIISGVITFSFLIVDFIRSKNLKKSLADCTIILIFVLTLWALMYHNLSGFYNYCVGMYHLAGDNSAAAAYYPVNNWFLLVPFLFIISSISFLQKNEKSKLFGYLLLPALFAGWKYGMAREDFIHTRILLFFVTISLILFIIYNGKHLIINTLASFFALFLFAANMQNTENSQPLSINYSGILNFSKCITSYSEVKAKAEIQNQKNIEQNRLPVHFREIIGEHTADIYPWDYTLVAANKLNWQGRPVIQSYAAYTPWLDRQNAQHFASANAPEFVVTSLNNLPVSFNGGRLESIDYRYLLNDEPQTIIELLSQYETVAHNTDFLIWKKRKARLQINSELSPTLTGKINEWIPVPPEKERLLRLRLHLKKNLTGHLKSFFYKDELYFMYLKTADGPIFKYRIVPQNAEDGIWISPFYLSAGDATPSREITHVLITCSNKKKIAENVQLEWDHLNIKKSGIDHFLGKDSSRIQQTFVNETFSPDSANIRWSGIQPGNIKRDNTTDRNCYLLRADEYSPVLTIEKEKIPKSASSIYVECLVKSGTKNNATLVIDVLQSGGKRNWQGTNIKNQIIDPREINHVSGFSIIPETTEKITVYLIGQAKSPLLIYQLNVKLQNE